MRPPLKPTEGHPRELEHWGPVPPGFQGAFLVQLFAELWHLCHKSMVFDLIGSLPSGSHPRRPLEPEEEGPGNLISTVESGDFRWHLRSQEWACACLSPAGLMQLLAGRGRTESDLSATSKCCEHWSDTPTHLTATSAKACEGKGKWHLWVLVLSETSEKK